jgi:putative tricarboxylic transport membrane protein
VSSARAEPIKNTMITGVLFLGLAVGAFIESMRLPFGSVSTPAAGFFPAVLAVLLAITSLLACVDALRRGDNSVARAEKLTWKKLLLTIGSLLFFAFVFERLGYLVATFLFIIFLLRAVEQKSWALAIAVGLSASVGSYLIFGLLLGAPLPAGFLQI